MIEIKISKSRANFIPAAKANLARKHLKLTTNRRKTLEKGVLQFDLHIHSDALTIAWALFLRLRGVNGWW